MEIWEDIPNYKGLYQVSDLGNVKSIERKVQRGEHTLSVKERILKPLQRKDGYTSTALTKNGKCSHFLTHQLVAMAFLGHFPNRKVVVDHKNDLKNDNRLNNLQIITQRRNSIKKNRGAVNSVGVHFSDNKDRFVAQITIKGKLIYLGSFETEKEAKKEYRRALKQIENGEELTLIRTEPSSKHKGVCWHKKDKKWVSQSKHNGKWNWLGSYNTEIEAHEAYVNFEKLKE